MGAGNKLRAPLSNRQRKILKKAGRHRLFDIPRQPNGQPSRAKAYRAKTDPQYSWLAPVIVLELNMHPVDTLEKRGVITADQRRAAYTWIADRAASGLPKAYITSPSLDMVALRAASEDHSIVGAAKRYNELTHILKNRCGVLGHSLAHEAIIQGHLNRVVENYLYRTGQKPALDPTERQYLVWRHLMMAFEVMEGFYSIQAKRRLAKGEQAA